MLVSWVVAPGDGLVVPLREWVDGSGCDAWLLHYGTDDPLTHAGNWLRHEIGRRPGGLRRGARPLARATSSGSGSRGSRPGAVILRRRAARTGCAPTSSPATGSRPASDHILRVFAAGTSSPGLADERALLAERFSSGRAARGSSSASSSTTASGTADRIELRLEDGLGFTATLDPATAALLAALDGTRTLGEAADDLARLEGTPRAAVEQAAVPVVAGLLAAGFLERATG